MRQRLQKILSARGVASRRRSEEMIQNGQVTVNGIAASLGDSADPETDEIRVNGQLLPGGQQSVYILLNKPRGYVTTLSDEKGRLAKEYCYDGLHLNAQGFEIVSENIIPLLK